MQWHYSNAEKQRWYLIEMNCGAAGAVELIQKWGGIGKAASGQKRRLFDALLDANEVRQAIHHTRLKHGYRQVEPMQLSFEFFFDDAASFDSTRRFNLGVLANAHANGLFATRDGLASG